VSGDLVIDLGAFEAFLFDLDGVITMTADIHATAWKRLFDEALAADAARTGAPFVAFDIATDYRAHVDGKPRRAGIRDFLASRGIQAAPETVQELAHRKNRYFLDALEREGLRVYEGAVRFVREARARHVKTAVVSASRNTAEILRVAKITALFQARVDGVEAARLGLPGKPDPAPFLEAARRLGVPPARAVVFEDATAGVEAGRRGGFGLVVGVGPAERAEALRRHGAHVVVADLGTIRLSPREDAAA
jgi:beta-phosphoglucomutase family hydrolase